DDADNVVDVATAADVVAHNTTGADAGPGDPREAGREEVGDDHVGGGAGAGVGDHDGVGRGGPGHVGELVVGLADAQVVLHVQVGGVGAAVVAGVGVVGPADRGRVGQRAGGRRVDGGVDGVGDRAAGGDEVDDVVDIAAAGAVAADAGRPDAGPGDVGEGRRE